MQWFALRTLFTNPVLQVLIVKSAPRQCSGLISVHFALFRLDAFVNHGKIPDSRLEIH